MRLDTRPVRRVARRVGRAAPVVAMLMLLAWPAVLARGGATDAELARQASIAASMKDVPQILGRWASTDVVVPTEATQILHPNAILSRRFSEIGGSRVVTLALIHCSDVRDMNGHAPPKCYPANGWSIDSNITKTLVVEADDGRKWPLRFDRFTRAENSGGVRVMSVLHAFLLPDGRLVNEMEALSERSVRKAVSVQGVAQIQFVFDGDVAAELTAEVVKELLSALPSSLLLQLGAGKSDQQSGNADYQLKGAKDGSKEIDHAGRN